MVIGNGLIAKAFKQSFQKDQNILFFASGVSNSNENRSSEFEREKNLLIKSLEIYRDQTFIYFSSCDVYSTDHSKYFSHKLNMENLVKTKAKKYYIFRLPQVVGKTKNTNTLIGFLYSKIQNDSEFVLWKNARRNLIDVDDVVSIVKCIVFKKLEMNSTMNIAAPIDYSVEEIVFAFENLLNKRTSFTLEDKGSAIRVDTTNLNHIFAELKMTFSKNYLDNLLKKYY